MLGKKMSVRAKMTAVMQAWAAAGMQNVGGWGGEAIEYIRRYGLVHQELWPNDAKCEGKSEPVDLGCL